MEIYSVQSLENRELLFCRNLTFMFEIGQQIDVQKIVNVEHVFERAPIEPYPDLRYFQDFFKKISSYLAFWILLEYNIHLLARNCKKKTFTLWYIFHMKVF